MRRLVVGLVVLTLMAVPAISQAVEVFKTPYIPVPPPEPTAGTVVISTSVFDGLMWATDQTVVLAGPTIDTDCGERPAGAT